MKVALYGNVCNNMYALAKAFRENSGIDAHLYLPQDVNIHNAPESEDPEIAGNYPSWIHRGDKYDATRFFKTFKKDFVNELNQYDVFIVSDIGIALAPYVKPKSIFLTTGADLTRMPFFGKSNYLFPGIGGKLKALYMSLIQRRGIKKAHSHWTQPFFPFTDALKKLDIPEERIRFLFRVIVDTDSIKYNPDAWSSIDPVIKKQLEPFKFIMMHPSRLMIRKNKELVESGQWKQNDLFFKGFAEFLKKHPEVTDACLVMPDRIYSNDIDIARQMIRDLGIEKNVVWIKGKSDQGFTKKELVDLYSISHLVIDEFGIGWFGSIVLEGLACEKPTMCYVNEDDMKKMYPWHPIISTNTVEGIVKELESLYTDPQRREELGKKGRQWAIEYHSTPYIAKMYENELRRLGNGQVATNNY